MDIRGLYNTNGEMLGYAEGGTLYDLDGATIGTIHNTAVRDQSGRLVWRVRGHGVYTPEGRPVGYLGDDVRREALNDILNWL
jgi:hypothetical protein